MTTSTANENQVITRDQKAPEATQMTSLGICKTSLGIKVPINMAQGYVRNQNKFRIISRIQGRYRSPTKHSSSLSDTHAEVHENDTQDEVVYLPLVEFQNLTGELEKARRQLKEQEQKLKAEKDKLDRVQKAALALADRFQPTVDTKIKDLYKLLDQKVLQVCKSLHDLIPQNQQPGQWPQEARWEPFIHPVKFSDKRSRRVVLIGVVWKFLVDNIFDQRFSCFGGDLSQKVNEVHAKLFASMKPTLNRNVSRSLTEL